MSVSSLSTAVGVMPPVNQRSSTPAGVHGRGRQRGLTVIEGDGNPYGALRHYQAPTPDVVEGAAVRRSPADIIAQLLRSQKGESVLAHG